MKDLAMRGEAPNRLMLRWLKTVVVSDEEKASLEASGRDQEDERKRIIADVSKQRGTTSEPEMFSDPRDESGGSPSIGQMVSGMKMT
ncbi:hypothetical protein V7793_22805 [Streptomyces sp. KLMMK]|uniref:hypothetical protein n=1 Tax=Streptomyces sp. KLMMK TaxID=3109353 RepID=UPI00300BC3E1